MAKRKLPDWWLEPLPEPTVDNSQAERLVAYLRSLNRRDERTA